MESCRADLQIVQPRRVQRSESYVMGVELWATNPPPAQPLTADPQLWQRFSAEARLKIPDSVQPDVLYGVYTNYSTHSSPAQPRHCAVIMAVEVSSIDNPPEEMVGLSIPAGDYLVFEAMEASPTAISQTWQQIKRYFTAGAPYQRAFTTDFEQYDPHAQQQVKIYVAIQSV